MKFSELEEVHRHLDYLKSEPTTTSPKTVCGLDALYYQLVINWDDYNFFYKNVLLNRVLENDDLLELKSFDYEKQYTFFDLKYINEGSSPDTVCTIGFKNLNRKDNQECIKIQMSSFFMNNFGYEDSVNHVHDYLRGLGLEVHGTKITRLDLNTYFQGHDFSYLNYNLFSTRTTKSNIRGNSGVLETFELGARSSETVFLRIYNKRIELSVMGQKDYSLSLKKQALIQEKFIKKYGAYHPIDQYELWNIEFEIKRQMLRRYNINTLEDLWSNVDSLHKDICTNTYRLLDSPKTQTHTSRKDNSLIWDILVDNYKLFNEGVNIDREKMKQYRQDDSWLKNRLDDFLSYDFNLDSSYYKEILDLRTRMSRNT